jgi:DNA-binding Xre family transcriptional regulator
LNKFLTREGAGMAFDYSKLEGLIKEKCGTRKKFAELINLSEHSVSVKINNKRQWKPSEINKACEVLGIQPMDIPLYFFTPKVQSA